MATNETELIIQCQKGDKEAFGTLYDRYIRKIYNFVYYKTFHKETAEDLTSQTFLKALSNIQSFDAERPFGSWLYKIAQNTVVDHYRTKKSNDNIDDHHDSVAIASDEKDIITSLDEAREVERVRQLLATLSDIERDIITMRVWQDMPYKDIADIVDKTEANCKMIYSRAFKKLREKM